MLKRRSSGYQPFLFPLFNAAQKHSVRPAGGVLDAEPDAAPPTSAPLGEDASQTAGGFSVSNRAGFDAGEAEHSSRALAGAFAAVSSQANVARRGQTLSSKTRSVGPAEPTLFDLPAGDQDVSHSPVVELPRVPPAPERTLTVQFQVMACGEKAKARDILQSIRVLKSIESQRRPATDEERIALGRFSGFGPVALSIFPDPVHGRFKDSGWQTLGEELRGLLTPEEYDSAKRTTFNAFYTSSVVMSAIHQAIERLGVADDATILEPGCGIGNFMGMAKPGMRFIGIEMDLISGRIAKALYPAHDIRIENFRDTQLPEASLDAVIGNVPFADLKLAHRGQKFSLHDFFFAKSIDYLKPAGVLALVTSHFTLDKQNASIREYLSDRADFVGAIRLPSDAFKREGTTVGTDIVFLRRRESGTGPAHVDPDWLEITPLTIDGVEIAVNRYFLNHPEMVLGTWSRHRTMYGTDGYIIDANGDLAVQLNEAIQHLPKFTSQPVRRDPIATCSQFAQPPPADSMTEGSFFIGDARVIHQIQDGRGVPVAKRSVARGGAPCGEGSAQSEIPFLCIDLWPHQQDDLQQNRRRHLHPPHAQPREVQGRSRRDAGDVAGGI
jgi:hypothetical protein